MGNRRICLLWICLIIGLILGGVNRVFAEETSNQTINNELFEKAIALKEAGDYETALNIFKKIADDSNKDQIQYTDALVEQSMILKDKNNPEWFAKAKKAGYKIKVLYSKNYPNPDYWMVYAKYSALVNKERHVIAAFRKLFYFSPDNVEGYIAKGDTYVFMAINTDPLKTYDRYHRKDHQLNKKKFTRQKRGKIAKEAYETALMNPTLENKRKAYVHYKLGKLETEVFSNKEKAVENWKKAVGSASESIYGKKSAELLKSY